MVRSKRFVLGRSVLLVLTLLVFSTSARAQISVLSGGSYVVPETISLAPNGFGALGGRYIITDAALNNNWSVPSSGGSPTPFGTTGAVGGLFLPTGWGGGSGKFLISSNTQPSMLLLDSAGNAVAFDPLNANFTTPALAPTGFKSASNDYGGNLFVTDQNNFIWRADPAGGGLTLFKDLHGDAFFGLGSPFGIEFTPSTFGSGPPPRAFTFANQMLVSDAISGKIVAIDADGTTRPFASISLKPGQTGLRQLLIAPADFFRVTLGLSGQQLLVSVSGSGQGGGFFGELLAVDATGAIVAHLKAGSMLAKFDPRGMIVAGSNILVSDTSDPIVQVSASDFAPGEQLCAPRVSPSVAAASLWPPNQNFVNVGLSASAADSCAGVSLSLSVSVFSNEGGQARDLVPGSLQLLADRDGNGDGRVYLIVVRATDPQSSAFGCETVVVPHDQGRAAAVNARAAAAKTFCSQHGGAAPSGYSPIH